MQNWHVDPQAQPTAESMICQLAGVCNGAATWDGAGFSKFDASFGHSLADRVLQGKSWTVKQAEAALKMLRKYQGQVGGKDFMDTWLTNPVFRYNPVGLTKNAEATPIENDRKLTSNGSVAVFTFKYESELVNSIKTSLKGEHRGKNFWASWDPSNKSWTVPVNETSIWSIMDLAERFGFDVEKRFYDYLDKIQEKTEESSVMLSLNGGRNIVLSGDTITISVKDVAILEEFEHELATN